jgi:hypothetical protein
LLLQFFEDGEMVLYNKFWTFFMNDVIAISVFTYVTRFKT